jgi:hypothetical protein
VEYPAIQEGGIRRKCAAKPLQYRTAHDQKLEFTAAFSLLLVGTPPTSRPQPVLHRNALAVPLPNGRAIRHGISPKYGRDPVDHRRGKHWI